MHLQVVVVDLLKDRDPQDKKENQDLLCTLKVLQEQLEKLVPTDFAVTTDHPETLVFQETPVLQDVTVYLVKRVSLDHLEDTS